MHVFVCVRERENERERERERESERENEKERSFVRSIERDREKMSYGYNRKRYDSYRYNTCVRNCRTCRKSAHFLNNSLFKLEIFNNG